ncbi:MAG: putative metal-dependent hydrolase [Gemmatimonadota bacterium]|nr:putative metal-dependent hydrolase [Gemmatimonadota bacterium]MDH5760139.1 putative metal-dependent hydrolase [Gemmatimonadota bacterium]
MTDPRFPVGRLDVKSDPLTPLERAALIEIIALHPQHLLAAVDGLDDEQVDTPYREDGWTVRQLVHHIADSHMNSYVRFKMAVTADHPTICTYDQDAWADLEDTRDDISVSLDLITALHRRWSTFLSSLLPEDFSRTVHHPEMGSITVDTLLEVYAWHCRHHTAHVTELRHSRGW